MPLAPRLAPAIADIQSELAGIRWLRPLPAHFLHVTIGYDRPSFTGVEPFEIQIGQVNCFHEAVFLEVEDGGRLRTLADDSGLYLPHVSIAYTSEPGDPAQLRNRLTRLRGRRVGRQRVDEVALCRVPASRTTILEPWDVLERVALA